MLGSATTAGQRRGAEPSERKHSSQASCEAVHSTVEPSVLTLPRFQKQMPDLTNCPFISGEQDSPSYRKVTEPGHQTAHAKQYQCVGGGGAPSTALTKMIKNYVVQKLMLLPKA